MPTAKRATIWTYSQGRKAGRSSVIRSTKFEFVINLSRKTLGLDIPERMLSLSDEVIK